MIIAGILWGKCSPNKELIKKIEKLTAQVTNLDNKSFYSKGITLITGRDSKNDFDTVIQQQNKILVGRVFSKNNHVSLTAAELMRLNEETLLKNFWGKYLFLSDQPHQEKITILRDPTGQLSFFYGDCPDGVILFSSELSIVYDALPIKPSLNYPYLTSNILYGTTNSTQTAFSEIKELPPGCALALKQSNANISVQWKPQDYVWPQTISSEEIIHTIQSSLEVWHAPYQNLYLSYSGGLDSTSLLYALKSTKKDSQKIRAVNLFHPGVPQSDELKHAQGVCDELAVELIKMNLSKLLPFSGLDTILPERPNKPFPMLAHWAQAQKIKEIIDSDESSLFITGQGGDQIFLAPPPKTMLIDYICEKGLCGVRNQLDKLSQYYRTSFYNVLKCNLSSLVNLHICPHKEFQGKETAPWMSKEFKELGRNPHSHPLYPQLPYSLKRGKCAHIQAIEQGVSSVAIDQLGRTPMFNPLLYPPTVELALSLPTYESLEEGYDRFPIRNAISKTFNTNSVWRRSKGETSGVTQLGIRENMQMLEELCLNGIFVRENLVDKNSLKQHLHRVAQGESLKLWPLTNLISTEIFLKCWNIR